MYVLFSSLFSSMRGRQQLSCPVVLRPPSGPNARHQDNIPLHKGNNENSLELIPIKEIITSQELDQHSKIPKCMFLSTEI